MVSVKINTMSVFYKLLLLFVLQSIIMMFSLTYDYSVAPVVFMVLFVSFMLVLGSYVGSKFIPVDFLGEAEVSSGALFRLLGVAIFFSIMFFMLKLYLNFEQINFESYYTIRGTFLMLSDDAASIFFQMSSWLGLVAAGFLLSRIGTEKVIPKLMLIFAAVVLSIIFTGARSVILLFAMSYFAGVRFAVKDIFNKYILIVVIAVVFLLVVLGYLRDISIEHILTPLDSFVVGPHLLHQNMDTILSQKEYLDSGLSKPPGYALFSGLYVGLNILLSYIDIEVFQYHLEAIFWKRHQFDYIPAFDEEYNSYYTVGLAVVIEGWFKVGIMCFMLGFLPTVLVNPLAKMVVLSLVLYFSLNLFKLSIFQNFAISLLFFSAIIFEVFCRFYKRFKYVENI